MQILNWFSLPWKRETLDTFEFPYFFAIFFFIPIGNQIKKARNCEKTEISFNCKYNFSCLVYEKPKSILNNNRNDFEWNCKARQGKSIMDDMRVSRLLVVKLLGFVLVRNSYLTD